MSLKHTILGFLSWKSLTGYEIKKHFAEIDFIPWQGNNNQVYKGLMELEKSGYVIKKIVHQENLPSQKIYSITDSGTLELSRFILTDPELPISKNTFILQIAFAGNTDNKKLNNIIEKYQYELEMKLALLKEKLNRKSIYPDSSDKQSYIWEMLWVNRINHLKTEINWVTQIRNGISTK